MVTAGGVNLTDDIGQHGFRLARWLDVTAKVLLILGMAGVAITLALAFTAEENTTDAIGLVAAAAWLALGTWLQFLLLSAVASLLEMAAYRTFFLEDDDEESE